MSYNLLQIDTRNNLNVLLSGATAIATLVTADEKVYDADGNGYNQIQIGNQVWLTSNLKTTKTRIGVSLVKDTDYTYYSGSTVTGNTYGYMYQWGITTGSTICPVGFHIPSRTEWYTLLDYVNINGTWDSSGHRWRGAGGILKEIGTTHWISPNSGASDTWNYNLLPGGVAFHETPSDNASPIRYIQLTQFTNLWASSNILSTGSAWAYQMSYSNTETYETNAGYPGNYYASIRCIKD